MSALLDHHVLWICEFADLRSETEATWPSLPLSSSSSSSPSHSRSASSSAPGTHGFTFFNRSKTERSTAPCFATFSLWKSKKTNLPRNRDSPVLRLITSEGFNSAFTTKLNLFLAVDGLHLTEDLVKKSGESVGLLRGLRPRKVGAERNEEWIEEVWGHNLMRKKELRTESKEIRG